MAEEIPTVYDIPEFKVYSGTEFLNLNFKPREWIIESMVKEGDAVLFVGNAKAGKSLMIQQMIFSLTSGKPFISDFAVHREYRVLYVMLEGDVSEMQSRYKRMVGAIPFKQENFYIFNSEPQYLANMDERNMFIDKIKDVNPEIIIIDPIYMACLGGSLSDDDVVRDFLASLRLIKMRFNCTLIAIHHTHKEHRTKDGDVIDDGDSAAFGSVFFQAWPDHILMLKYEQRSGIRTMTCKTQRSNEIEKAVRVKLNENPLHFEELHEVPSGTVINISKERIIKLLDATKYPLSAKEIYKQLEIPRSTFHHCKNELIKEHVIKNETQNHKSVYFLTKWLTPSFKETVQS